MVLTSNPQPKPKVVTVITPTWQRHEYLFDRCIPSVMNQTYAYTEHIVVSDGPDPELRMLIENYVPQLTHVRYFELAEHPVAECLQVGAR
jgi:GT2 family glycosyltransferase